ncbi:MAG: CAP domain-containing protein [Desertimonas sp.]
MGTATLVPPTSSPPIGRLAHIWAWLRHAGTRHLGAFGVTAVLALGAGGELIARCTPAPAPSQQQQVVDLVNQRRAQAGLPALRVDYRLSNAAQAHSQDQAARRVMSHIGSNGSTVGTRVTRAGYRWSRVVENVAAGYGSAGGAVTGWMNSPSHRANVLDPKVIHIGVGLAYSSNGTPYWTMDAARPG